MTVVLDERTFVVRPIQPTDAERLVAFHEALDPLSQYRRFFTSHPHLGDTEVEHFTHVDHVDREALVVLDDERIVAVGRYDRLREDPGAAEVAFVTAVGWRRCGLASMLLQELAALARERGIHRFVAETLAENTEMRAVFHHAGFPATSSFADGVAEIRMELDDA
jgi:RimJ/RimL family protein N-acetyltransferase